MMIGPKHGICFLLLALAACSESAGDVKPRKAFAKLRNIQIYYEDCVLAGEGNNDSAVVLVHGWACDHSSWHFQEPALRGKVRSILIDLPGHGLSSKPPAVRYTMDLFCDAVNAVLEDCGVKQAVLVGHSNGVPVIRQFYRRFPEKTRGLVAVDGALMLKSTKEQSAAAVKMFSQRDYKDTARRWLASLLKPSKIDDRRKRHVEDVVLNTPQHVMVSSLQESYDPKIWTELRIEVPLLVINAKQPWFDKDYIDYVKKLGPDVDYREMEGLSHFLMMDAPEAFNDLLLAFLRRVGLVPL
jgi:pimeloyl-ACP methyl ester carboxylesterase